MSIGLAPGAAGAAPALWKISDADSHIYVFGTFHLLPSGCEWLDGPVREALGRSERLVMELDLSPETMWRAQLLSIQRGIYGEGETLTDKLTAEELAILKEVVGSVGLPEAQVRIMRPWFASATVTSVTFARQGFDAGNSAEKELDTVATGLALGREGLETVDEQIAMLADADESAQLEMLREALAGLSGDDGGVTALGRAWTEGDLDALQALMDREFANSPEARDRLLVRRNRNWTPRIAGFLDDDVTAFVAVGAGHLVGADNVLDLLAVRGFTVERLQ